MINHLEEPTTDDGEFEMEFRRERSRSAIYEPPTSHEHPSVCGNCVAAWGISIMPMFSLLNTRTGKYHSGGDYGTTDCNVDATGDHWLWPL